MPRPPYRQHRVSSHHVVRLQTRRVTHDQPIDNHENSGGNGGEKPQIVNQTGNNTTSSGNSNLLGVRRIIPSGNPQTQTSRSSIIDTSLMNESSRENIAQKDKNKADVQIAKTDTNAKTATKNWIFGSKKYFN